MQLGPKRLSSSFALESKSTRTITLPSAISQTHSPRVDNWLIPQALALRDKVGSFCRRKKTSERAAAGPPAGKAEGSARRPHRGARRISIVAGIQLESG